MTASHLIAGLLVAFTAMPAAAGFTGRVLDASGRPVRGAVVSASRADTGRTTSVYADADGRFALPDLPDGSYQLRARRFGFRDGIATEQRSQAKAIVLRMEEETDPYDRVAALPSNRWFALALAAMPDETMREEFDRQCTFCHQQGSWATRVERDEAQWQKIFSLMARMGGVLSARTREQLPNILNTAYDHTTAIGRLEQQVASEPLPDPSGLRAVIDEWEMGDRASVQHDLVVHPDGHIYSVDTTKDFLHRLDPATGERRHFKIPDAGLPIGGVFATGAGTVLPPNADARVAPHSLQVAPDGRIWVTLCLGNKIGVFDPRSEQWTLIDQETGLYPHTLRFDAKGRVWYTLAVSSHVATIDPATGKQRTIALPGRSWKQTVAARLTPYLLPLTGYFGTPETLEPDLMPPLPYGIDIGPDGGIWFSQLNVRRIGRIDPDTGDYELFDTPFPGPRRLRFDSKGGLWIPGFSAGVVARFDPQTKRFQTWDLPTRPKGTETPYALNVDRRTDTVWICGTNSDTLIRFEPREERFTIFPLPSRVSYTREIDFDDKGGVWTSNSNTPGWHIELGNPQLIRLMPGADTTLDVAAAR